MRDLDTLAKAGHEKITNRRSLYASDIVQLLSEANLRGSDGLIELISKVYAIGFEKGYTAGQYDIQKKRQSREVVRV